MLIKFKVKNFKNFSEELCFDLSSPSNYEFNVNVIENGCVSKALIYGPNGSGKSNLGLALFDIIVHLTENQKNFGRYSYYLNLDGAEDAAKFEYVFKFSENELTYRYEKKDVQVLLKEEVLINGRSVIKYDFLKNEGYVKLKGCETLNFISNTSPISRIKFVYNNAILDKTTENMTFIQFMEFVNRMLLFYSLDTRGYLGFMTGTHSIPEEIIKSGTLREFERFLRDHGLDYKLYKKKMGEDEAIFCKYQKQDAEFWNIASTGTLSLAVFYYWYIKMSQASFVFIDEFDAFYHYELAYSLVKKLSTMKGIQVMLTTHNTDLMTNDLLRPDCYFLIDKKKIVALSDCTDKELRKAHNLQKMYKAGAFRYE